MAGSITAYDTAAGKRYRVRYRKPDKSQTDKRGFKTKKEAQLFLASITVSKASGEYIDPQAARITVGVLGEAWLKTKKNLKPSSYHSLEVAWRVHVKPRWGTTQIGDIKPSAVEAWITEMSAGTAITARSRERRNTRGPRSATVVLRALGVLAGILDGAVRDRRIPKNPARGARNLPQKISKKQRRYLTDDEVIRLASATKNHTHATLVLVLAYCGIRWSEAVGLRVSDINQLRRRLHINRAAVEVDGNIEVGAPKTWEKRTVPYPAFLTKALETQCEGKPKNALVFSDASGNYLRRAKTDEDANSWFAKAIKAAGLERLTPHDLRHTAASLAISSGANVKAVQRMLGHKSASMTLDTYADLFDDDLDDVAARLHDRAGAAATNALQALEDIA
ncbi:tyrosine-type recombinase/integrase [Microbacterium sp. YY-01]|uniref:tyrosine-type recombinase/integrase n=1 Tax=Microbacterium sp. YY-01 TaxID=3421634 RepID=UPI003D164533